MSTPDQDRVLDHTAGIVASFVSHNAVPIPALPDLIADVYGALVGLYQPAAPPAEAPKPAVQVAKSITPDAIICLEDGKRFKTLKRHLWQAYGMTPQAYRDKWGLPPTYPMVAPNYSAARSALAKAVGLGTRTAA